MAGIRWIWPDLQAVTGINETITAVPETRFATIAGDTMLLHAERGNVVLVYFWAPWCSTCRRDLPDVQAVHAARASEELTVVGLSTDRRVADVTANYAHSRGVTFRFGQVSIPRDSVGAPDAA